MHHHHHHNEYCRKNSKQILSMKYLQQNPNKYDFSKASNYGRRCNGLITSSSAKTCIIIIIIRNIVGKIQSNPMKANANNYGRRCNGPSSSQVLLEKSKQILPMKTNPLVANANNDMDGAVMDWSITSSGAQTSSSTSSSMMLNVWCYQFWHVQ